MINHKHTKYVYPPEIQQDLMIKYKSQLTYYVNNKILPSPANENTRLKGEHRYWLRDRFLIEGNTVYTYEEWKTNIWKGMK